MPFQSSVEIKKETRRDRVEIESFGKVSQLASIVAQFT